MKFLQKLRCLIHGHDYQDKYTDIPGSYCGISIGGTCRRCGHYWEDPNRQLYEDRIRADVAARERMSQQQQWMEDIKLSTRRDMAAVAKHNQDTK